MKTSDFWDFFVPKLTEDRQKIVWHLWENLNVKNEPKISLIRLKNRFFGKLHPKAISKKETVNQIEKDFVKNIDFHGQVFGNTENYTTVDQFQDLMTYWSATEPDEQTFLNLLVECFRLSEFYGVYNTDILHQPQRVNDTEVPVKSTSTSRHTEYSNRSRHNKSRFKSQTPNEATNLYGGSSASNNLYGNDNEDVNIYNNNANQQISQRGNPKSDYGLIPGNKHRGHFESQPDRTKNDIKNDFYKQNEQSQRAISRRRDTNSRRSNLSKNRITSNRRESSVSK